MTLFLIIGLTSCCMTVLAVAVAIYFISQARNLEKELQTTSDYYQEELSRFKAMLHEGKKNQPDDKPRNQIGFAFKEAS